MKTETINLFKLTESDDIYAIGKELSTLRKAKISTNEIEEIALSFINELELSVQEIFDLNKRHVYVAKSIDAIHLFLWSHLPDHPDIDRLPDLISELGAYITLLFKKTPGQLLCWDETKKLFDYMSHTFDYFERVFPDSNPYILFFDNQATSFVSEYISFTGKENAPPLFVIPGVSKGLCDYHTYSVEAVIFHAFAKALVMQFFNPKTFIPSFVLDRFMDMEIYEIHDYKPRQQLDIVADALCMGFMYDSPYHYADPFIHVPAFRKQQYRDLVELMLNKC